MMRTTFGTAICGMLQYYGVIPLSDLFLLCCQCELFQLTEYTVFLRKMQKELNKWEDAFLYKKLVCHKNSKNPIMIRDIQKTLVAKEYKFFSLEAYLQAGRIGFVWGNPLRELKVFLEEHGSMSRYEIERELRHLWLELNNMTELVLLTAQCVKHFGLEWEPEMPEYMTLLEKIRNVAEQLPSWSCKGYSRAELRELDRIQKGT